MFAVKYIPCLRKISLALTAATGITFFSCTGGETQKERFQTDSSSDRLTVGTFNIAWLGDGNEDKVPRSEQDYRRVAQTIADMKADIIGVQEVENTAALDSIVRFLPDYTYQLGTSAREQNVGILYRKELTVQPIGEYEPIAITKGRNRPGYLASCKKGNFDFQLMVVHFKSTSGFDDTPQKKQESREVRAQQADILRRWMHSFRKENKEQDLIVVGDFNCSPDREKYPTLTVLVNDTTVNFVSKGLRSCKRADWEAIDHILVSTSAQKRYIPNSLFVLDFKTMYSKDESEKISDHCPVIAQFDITTADND